MSSLCDIPNTFVIATVRQRYPLKSANGIPKDQIGDKLKSAILEEDFKLANSLAAEMVISMYYHEMWDVIFSVWIEHIHLKHIGMLSWLLKNYHRFNHLKTKYGSMNLKNQQEIRNLIAQIVTVLCVQSKLKIEVKVGPRSAELSANSKELAMYYYNGSKINGVATDEDVIMALAQFIEFYNQNALKNAHHWINELLNSEHRLKPCKGFRVGKKVSYLPIWLIWSIMYNIAEKKGIDTIVLNDLRQLFMYFITAKNKEYSLLYTYIMVSYVKHSQKITNVPVDTLNRHVLKAVICINHLYQSLQPKSIELPQAPAVDKELDESVLVANAGKKRPNPKVVFTGGKPNKMLIKVNLIQPDSI